MFKIIKWILLLTFLSSPSWSETIIYDDLVYRNGLYYKKFTDVPFSGKITGQSDGNFKNGKIEGIWRVYNKNGQLTHKTEYKDGKKHGFDKVYYENGKLNTQLNYKNGNLHGLVKVFFENGQLMLKGYYEDGKENGLWEYFNVDGTLEKTKIYKDGWVVE